MGREIKTKLVLQAEATGQAVFADVAKRLGKVTDATKNLADAEKDAQKRQREREKERREQLQALDAFIRLTEKAVRALGAVYQATASKALEFRQAWDGAAKTANDFERATLRAQVALGDGMLPAITGIERALIPVADRFKEWAEQNKKLISGGLIGFLAGTARLLAGGVAIGALAITTAFNGAQIAAKGVEVGLAAIKLKLAELKKAALPGFLGTTAVREAEDELSILRGQLNLLAQDQESRSQEIAAVYAAVSATIQQAEDEAAKAVEEGVSRKAIATKRDLERLKEQEKAQKEAADAAKATKEAIDEMFAGYDKLQEATFDADEKLRQARERLEKPAADDRKEARFQEDIEAYQKREEAAKQMGRTMRAVGQEVASLGGEFAKAGLRTGDWAGAIDSLKDRLLDLAISKGIDLLLSLLTGGIGGGLLSGIAGLFGGGGGGIGGGVSGLSARGGGVAAGVGGGFSPGSSFGMGTAAAALAPVSVTYVNASPIPPNSAQMTNAVERQLGPALRRKIRRL